MRLRLLAVVFVTLALSAHADDSIVRSYVIRNLPAREANAIVRSFLTVDSAFTQNNTLVFKGTTEQLAQVERVLELVDVPVIAWTATIVAETADGDQVLQQLSLKSAAKWTAGDDTLVNDGITIDLAPSDPPGSGWVDLAVAVKAAHGTSAALRTRLSQRVTLGNPEVELARASGADAQSALAAMVGAESPVRALRLRFDREGAEERATKRHAR